MDSLHYLLETASNEYVEIDVLLALSRSHMLGEPPQSKGMDYANRALEIALELGDKAEEVNARLFVTMIKRNMAINQHGEHAEIRELALESGDPNAIAFSSYLWVEEELYASNEGIAVLEDLIQAYGDQLTKKNYGNVLKSLGWQYELVGRYAEAERTNLEAIAIFRSIGDEPDIIPKIGRPSAQVIDGGIANLIQTLIYNGQLYARIGRYEEAIQSGEEAYSIGKKHTLSDEAWTSLRLGGIYVQAGELNKAIDHFIQSEEIYKQIEEPSWLGSTLMELAGVYMTVGDYQQAELRLLEALDILSDLPSDRADVLRLLGGLYEQSNQYDNAVEAYLEADSLYVILDKPVLKTDCQFGIASAENRQGFSEAAIQRITDLVPILEEINDIDRMYNAQYRLSTIYGDNNRLIEALDHAQQALAIANQDTLDYQRLKSSHISLSQLEERSGNLDRALYHHKMYRYYDDKQYLESANQSLKAEQVRQNVKSYQADKEQAEQIAQLLSQQNKIYLIVAALLAGLLAIGSYLFLQLRRTRVLLASQNQELQELNHTKDRFFGIIAHDLRSPILALDSVDEQMSYYTQKGKLDKLESLSKMVGRTAKNLNALLDNLLNWALLQTGSIPYKPEMLQLANTVDETVDLLGNNAAIKEITIQKNIDEHTMIYADVRAVQTILRNLLSNAIKFCSVGDEIVIKAEQNAAECTISVSDTGAGMSDLQLQQVFSVDKKSYKGTAGEKGTGLGLILVRDLVELNKGELKIESQEGIGTIVTFTLPVIPFSM